MHGLITFQLEIVLDLILAVDWLAYLPYWQLLKEVCQWFRQKGQIPNSFVSNLPALHVCVCSHRYACTCQIYVVMHIFCMQITLVLQPQVLSTENCDLSSTGTGTKIPDSHFRAVTKGAFSLGKRKKLNEKKKKVTPKHQHLNSCFQVKWYHIVSTVNGIRSLTAASSCDRTIAQSCCCY